jgi:predicted DNA-binding protein (MmcQ/YjbR family)
VAKRASPNLAELKAAALAYPEAYAETPWGELAIKVRGKAFTFLSGREGRLACTVKLPDTQAMATGLDFAEPSGYGLGKSGWVTARFEAGEDVPVGLLIEWLDESYRAVAPKRLVKTLDGGPRVAAPKSKARSTSRPKARRMKQPKILLVGEDPLRLERAEAALGEAGFTQVSRVDLDGLAGVGRRRFAQVVVDMGRQPRAALPLVQERFALGRDGGLFLAGARDAPSQRRFRKALGPGVAVHRAPPGDPRVIGALIERLG